MNEDIQLTNKAVEVLKEKITELEDEVEELREEKINLQRDLDEFTELNFEELIRKSSCFDKLKKNVTSFRNSLLGFEDEVDEVEEETTNKSIISLVKEVFKQENETKKNS